MSPGGGETLAQRVATTRARREAEARAERESAARLPDADDVVPGVRHCWYDGPHGRQAALLLEWRQRAGSWSGRIMVAQHEPDGWVMVSLWVEGDMLSPIRDSD